LESYVGSNGVELCDSKVEVYVKGTASPSMTVGGSNYIKIGYSKSTGAFKCCNNGNDSAGDFYNEIQLKGKETFSVKLIKATGKHFVK
jgi:hypothetical protein